MVRHAGDGKEVNKDLIETGGHIAGKQHSKQGLSIKILEVTVLSWTLPVKS